MPILNSLAETHGAVIADDVFGERVRLTFLKNGALDPNRPSVEIEAVLRVGGGDENNMAGGYAQSWRTQLAAGKSELHINEATYAGPAVDTGDRVRALSRAGLPLFEVLRVDDRGETRLVLALGEV